MIRLEIEHLTRKIDVSTLDNLYSLYQRSKSISDVAAVAGIGTTTLHRKFRAAGYNTTRCLDPGIDIIRSLYVDQQLSSVHIGRIFNVYAETVCVWLKKYGLTRARDDAARVRMTRMTADERRQITSGAHAAILGSHPTFEQSCTRALAREHNVTHQSQSERDLLAMLPPGAIPQKAIGPYSADIAIGGVAVEVLGGNWLGGSRMVWPERTRYILDAGWSLIGIRVKRDSEPLTVRAAEHVIALVQETSSNPSSRCQYRVVRGTGELVIVGCADDNDFPIKPPRKGLPEIRCEHNLIAC